MKLVLVFACLTTLAASAAIDYSSIPPIHQLPEWQVAHPEMTKIFYGQGGVSGRVIGGAEATSPLQFPHQVFLIIRMFFGSGLCGGSIIHTEWILTASHCVDSSL